MGQNKVAFVGDRLGIITGSHVTGSDISHVTEQAMPGSMFMHNRKLRNIRLIGVFSPDVT
jgi:hypothetical protein